jgi:hypothetical protein
LVDFSPNLEITKLFDPIFQILSYAKRILGVNRMDDLTFLSVWHYLEPEPGARFLASPQMDQT